MIEIEGKKILLVGGAISIDRKQRLSEMQMYASNGVHKELYWYDEGFVLDKEKLESLTGIDIIVTHTSPDFCYPRNNNGFHPIVEHFAVGDETLKDELIKERKLVTEMWDIISKNNKISHYFNGHFHSSVVENIYGTEFRLLGVNEFFDFKSDIDYENELNKLYGE